VVLCFIADVLFYFSSSFFNARSLSPLANCMNLCHMIKRWFNFKNLRPKIFGPSPKKISGQQDAKLGAILDNLRLVINSGPSHVWRKSQVNFGPLTRNPLNCLPSRTHGAGQPHIWLCPKFLVRISFYGIPIYKPSMLSELHCLWSWSFLVTWASAKAQICHRRQWPVQTAKRLSYTSWNTQTTIFVLVVIFSINWCPWGE